MTSLADQLDRYRVVATMAHVHGLAAAGILSGDEARQVLGALADRGVRRQETGDRRAGGACPTPTPPSVGTWEREEIAARLEIGRGRRDQEATAFRLWTREAILDTASLLVELRQALTDLACRSGAALAPGVEPPVLLGHYLIAYVEQFYRDGNRLKEAYVRADILPLGAGDGAGVDVALDHGEVARLLGMHANTRNSVDGATDRDFAIECLASLAMIGARAARLVGDPTCGLGTGPARPLALASATADDWRMAVLAQAGLVHNANEALAALDAALFDSVGRTQEALRAAVRGVQAATEPGADTLTASPELERFVSRGGTAPTVVAAAIDDTHGRIDIYRQWIAERRAAHPTVEKLRAFPSDRHPTLLPHGEPPARRP